MIKFNNKILI